MDKIKRIEYLMGEANCYIIEDVNPYELDHDAFTHYIFEAEGDGTWYASAAMDDSGRILYADQSEVVLYGPEARPYFEELNEVI